MDERNRQNENEAELERFRGVLKEVEKRIQKNLKLLEDLREVKKILEMILGELRERKLERESAAWNAAADESGADGEPEAGAGRNSQTRPRRGMTPKRETGPKAPRFDIVHKGGPESDEAVYQRTR